MRWRPGATELAVAQTLESIQSDEDREESGWFFGSFPVFWLALCRLSGMISATMLVVRSVIFSALASSLNILNHMLNCALFSHRACSWYEHKGSGAFNWFSGDS